MDVFRRYSFGSNGAQVDLWSIGFSWKRKGKDGKGKEREGGMACCYAILRSKFLVLQSESIVCNRHKLLI